MNPEMWEELKCFVNNLAADTYGVTTSRQAIKIHDKMTDIERRTLPERVAEILENIDMNQFQYNKPSISVVILAIAKALRTGDTKEIEKWVK